MTSKDPLPQSRHLATAIPGPKSQELIARRKEAVSAGLGMAIPAIIERAEGAILQDVDGNRIIDLGAGIGVVNVGDSRLYLLSDGDLAQITEDHSLVATMERQGRLTAAEAAVHPQRNILTRALGIDGTVLVDSWEILPVIGDRYLICSDGLFNEVD